MFPRTIISRGLLETGLFSAKRYYHLSIYLSDFLHCRTRPLNNKAEMIKFMLGHFYTACDQRRESAALSIHPDFL